MDITDAGAWIGAANVIALFVVSCVRKRRFDYDDIAPAGAIFIASYNICPPFYLFYFVSNSATRATLPPTLLGYEKYIGLAAVCSFLITIVAVVSLYRRAYERP